MALSKEDIFKTGPSPEEEKYNTAVELMDAIDCVERFERAVTSLRSAAAMFEELGMSARRPPTPGRIWPPLPRSSSTRWPRRSAPGWG